MKCSFKALAYGVEAKTPNLELTDLRGEKYQIAAGATAFTAIIPATKDAVSFDDPHVDIPVSQKMAEALFKKKKPVLFKITVEAIDL